jgi:MscS family membrane protein
MVYCFTYTTVWGEWLELKEKLAFKIKEIVEEAGAGFAFPSQSLYVETVPPSKDELATRRNNADALGIRATMSND